MKNAGPKNYQAADFRVAEIEGSRYDSKNLPSPYKEKNKIPLQEHLFNKRRPPRVTSN